MAQNRDRDEEIGSEERKVFESSSSAARSPDSRGNSLDSSSRTAEESSKNGHSAREKRKTSEGKPRSPASQVSSGCDDPLDQDKKSRREAANSNERRRMMSINNGFLNLQLLLPKSYVKRGEKMSKAAILHSTVDFINKLLQDHQNLQVQNNNLMQKVNSTRLDSGGESNDEGVEVEVEPTSGAADLVTLIDHWKAKYNRERDLRAQTIEEFRRLIMDAIDCCPSGFSKRESFNAALRRRSKSPTPASDGQMAPSPKTSSPMPPANGKCDVDSLAPTMEGGVPVISIPETGPVSAITGSGNKGTVAPGNAGAPPDRASLKPLTGFDILYQAITYSETLDGPEPVCGSQDSGVVLTMAEEDGERTRKKRRK
ncbi:hypothetical protein BV898_08447 [Hypsibius exemplaris]|uniref:BHLH domain-containing protein n=1 Tax=Hypsibius exemplaris TaxID=2072580 RepID=A0A1W0WQN6_HYPEX|nr:hypothetical protein BV898_08447 [Hypsibius exemplaris]